MLFVSRHFEIVFQRQLKRELIIERLNRVPFRRVPFQYHQVSESFLATMSPLFKQFNTLERNRYAKNENIDDTNQHSSVRRVSRRRSAAANVRSRPPSTPTHPLSSSSIQYRLPTSTLSMQRHLPMKATTRARCASAAAHPIPTRSADRSPAVAARASHVAAGAHRRRRRLSTAANPARTKY
jgi:hypothetical protein